MYSTTVMENYQDTSHIQDFNNLVDKNKRIGADGVCRSRTGYVQQKLSDNMLGEQITCGYYYNYIGSKKDKPKENGIFSLHDIISNFGVKDEKCPYYFSQDCISSANIIVYCSNSLLDPKISNIISAQLKSDSIVVIDEAHNIDKLCLEVMSANISLKGLEQANKNVESLKRTVVKNRKEHDDLLRKEYETLLKVIFSFFKCI